MNIRRTKIDVGSGGVYHCMTRTVNGELLFKNLDKEMLRKPTRHQAAVVSVLTSTLASDSVEGDEIRRKLLARMGTCPGL